ncbi:MAG: exo-alpha-sialidase [Candidatus Krumholzibacteriia bacterium]
MTRTLVLLAVLASATIVLAQDWQNVRLNNDATTQLQNEQQVVVNPADPSNLVAAWRDFRLGYRQVGWGYTRDHGATWTNPGLFVDPYYPRDSDPALTVNAQGDFFAMLLAYTGDTNQPNGMLMYRSTDGGVTWEDRGFAVDGVPGVFEDKEFIACDRTDSFFRGRIYMAWARFYDADIYCVTTADEGATWSDEVLVSDSSGNPFPPPAVGPDGTLYVAWTNFGSSSIKIDRSFGGLAFGTDLTVTQVWNPDPTLNGNIPSPAHPALDVDISGGAHNGRLYIAYMSREGSNDYDIFIRHSDDQGQTWSASRRINDDAFNNGRDQFHVWLTVDNLGTVTVVWLDRRQDPSNLAWHCYLSQSTDGGLTWSANQQVSTAPSHPSDVAVPTAADGPRVPHPDEADTRAGVIGEYIGIACWDGYATPIWVDTRNGDQDTYGGFQALTAVPDDPAQTVVRLRVGPNPAGGQTALRYEVPADGPVTLALYDIKGRRIRTAVDRNLRRGAYEFVWDTTDQAGRRVPTGTYLARLRTGAGEELRAVTVTR